MEIIKRDKQAAARFYLTKSKFFKFDDIYPLLAQDKMTYSTTPQNTMKYANFLYKIGTIKTKPDSWKDYFFPDIHDQPGS